MKKFKVTLTTITETLGSAPADPEIYKSYIASKKNKEEAKKLGKLIEPPPEQTARAADIAAENQALAAEEVSLLPADDKGITVFRRNAGGLIFLDYQMRGTLKEAAEAISGAWGIRSKVDKFLFVQERYIPVMRDGKQVQMADGVLERPLRAETMKGPRVALAASEMLLPGFTLTFHIMLLPLGETKAKIDEAGIRSWLDYLALSGLGCWRTGSYGRCTYTMEAV